MQHSKLKVTKKYDLIAKNPESTVVAEYIRESKRAPNYQSEADLERVFIEQLQKQAYEYVNITSEEQLIANLRLQLEKLNDINLVTTSGRSFLRTK